MATAGPAFGDTYTPFNDPPYGEDSHIEIVEDIYAAYGGTWVPDGNGFTNGVINVRRVYDDDNGTKELHVVAGDQYDIDQLWTDGDATVWAEAKFADLTQSFGWNGGGDTGVPSSYIELLTEADINNGGVQIEITGDFLWGINPNGDYWWSLQSENPDSNTDHMITYYVEGLPDVDETVWLLFWEDLPYGGDIDYNDFVIEVRAIPEPGTFVLLGAGLAGLAAYRRHRRPGA